MELKNNEILSYHVFWARVHTFPFWPARYCSEPEGNDILKSYYKSNKIRSKPVIAVSFLGQKLEKGVVLENGISDFNEESMKTKFQLKRFQNDLDYRSAVIEAVRVAVNFGKTFSKETMKLVRDYPFEYTFDRTDVCTECGGTELSGPSLLCDFCDTNETHFHCLVDPVVTPPSGKWLCNTCCEYNGYPKGTILPSDENDESNIHENLDFLSDNTLIPKKQRRNSNKQSKRKRLSKTDEPDLIQDQTIANNHTDVVDIKESSLDNQNINGNSNNNSQSVYSSQISNNNKYDNHVDDEFCFVCFEGGKLILCDYPSCPRAYHQVCVLSTLPFPNITKENQDMDDVWFCPRHYCIQCHSLESHEIFKNYSTSSSIRLPSYHTTKDIPLKQLKLCSCCPFSICIDCELDVLDECNVKPNGKVGLLSQRRGALTKDLECLNCLSDSPLLKLSKLLEKSWIRLSTSRLSIPFLRPILPLKSKQSGTSDINFVISNVDTSLDILKLIEKIHSLQYISSTNYLNDLQSIRKLVIRALEQHTMFRFNNEVNQFTSAATDNNKENGNISEDLALYKDISTRMCNDILNGYDTLMDTCTYYILHEKYSIITNLDKKISEFVNDSSDSSDVIDSLTNTSSKLSNYLLKLWRKECYYSWRNYISASIKNNNNSRYLDINIDARSIDGWCEYINHGAMPELCKGLIDPWSIWNKSSTRSVEYINNSMNNHMIKDFLSYSVNSTYCDEFETADLMINMSNNLSNESVTLLENQPSASRSIDPWNKIYNKSIKSSKISTVNDIHDDDSFNMDESYIILERLQELTTKSLELQVKLKQDINNKKHKKTSIGDEIISFGEANLIKELLLSNDNLKWKLSQRNKAIDSCKVIINDLNQQNNQQNIIINDLKNQIEQLHQSTKPSVDESVILIDNS